jgi:hypothetical protein
MAQLYKNSLYFETVTGGTQLCSAHEVTILLVGDAGIDEQTLIDVTEGVVNYFKEELGHEEVTVAEYSKILAEMLTAIGYPATHYVKRRRRRKWRQPKMPYVCRIKKGATAREGRFFSRQ